VVWRKSQNFRQVKPRYQIQTPLIALEFYRLLCHFDPLHHIPMPRRAASSAAPAFAPAIPIREPPIHAPLFEGDFDDDHHDGVNRDHDEPAVLISPVKARAAKRGIANKTDLEVLDLPDTEIIGA
jgi:hypothetical protein